MRQERINTAFISRKDRGAFKSGVSRKNFVFRKFIAPLVGAACAAGAVLIIAYHVPQRGAARDAGMSAGMNHAPRAVSVSPSVAIGGVSVMVEIATTTSALEKGLSGRKSLGEDQGMLFIFPRADRWRFWMPDMRFPIDIIWIADDKVIDIDENVSNRFDPANPLFFTPSVPVRRVLEMNAGFAKKHGIGVGGEVVFNHIQ
ncbi:MAG: DUF192 domain-containing protein [Patescibacteria group bacterium]